MCAKKHGSAFGTQLLVGAPIWPTDESIPESLLDKAARIIAFDALIENHDRRHDRPNLFIKDDDMFVFDHEAAFPFAFPSNPPHPAWDAEGNRFLEDHAFYRQLKGRRISFDEFAVDLEALTDSKIDDISEAVPNEWRNENLGKITMHLSQARNHAWQIVDQL